MKDFNLDTGPSLSLAKVESSKLRTAKNFEVLVSSLSLASVPETSVAFCTSLASKKDAADPRKKRRTHQQQ